MKIQFDGKEFNVDNSEDNIVQVAAKNGFKIESPCFSHRGKGGFCRCDAIIADGKETLACLTKPHDGMVVLYDTEELRKLRAKRMEEFKIKIKKHHEEEGKEHMKEGQK